jgi:hypothetical protein
MTRPRYRRALRWIVENDYTEWLELDACEATIRSVAASLVADLFGHSDKKVEKDLRRMLKNTKRVLLQTLGWAAVG